MLPSPTQPGFPLGKTLALMTGTAALVMAAELLVIPMMFGKPPGAVQAVLLMGGVVWATGLLSVFPVMRSARRAQQQGYDAAAPFAVVRAFFMGMTLRVLVSLAMLAVAIKAMNLPPGPVAVALMMMYLPLLFVETRIVVGYVKRMDVKSDGDGNGSVAADARQMPGPHARHDQDSSSAPCLEVIA